MLFTAYNELRYSVHIICLLPIYFHIATIQLSVKTKITSFSYGIWFLTLMIYGRGDFVRGDFYPPSVRPSVGLQLSNHINNIAPFVTRAHVASLNAIMQSVAYLLAASLHSFVIYSDVVESTWSSPPGPSPMSPRVGRDRTFVIFRIQA